MSGLRFCPALLALLLVAPPGRADPDPSKEAKGSNTRSTHLIESFVLGAAGSPATSTHFKSDGTLGQSTPIGVGESTNFDLYAGFWKSIRIPTLVRGAPVPEGFRNTVFQNIPNPFNPLTTIRYEVAQTAPVEIRIYNIQGRLVRTLVQEMKAPGRHEAVWDGREDRGRSAGSGVYFYRLQVGDYGSVKKMVLVK